MAKNKGTKVRIAPVAQPYLVALAFFWTVCLCVNASLKVVALGCVAVTLVVAGKKSGRLSNRFNLPMLALAMYVVLGGVSTFYAVAGKFALAEFLKILISFGLAVLLLIWAPGEGTVEPGRQLATVLERFCALAGLLSIDLLSTRLLSGFFLGAFNLIVPDYVSMTGVEVGTRMTSIFENPNVFAGGIGIGVLLSLGLVLSSKNERERMGHLICLSLSALAFVLAFSMGATAFIAVAFIVYLVIERTERRADLFVLMVETLVVTMVGVVLIAATSFDAWDGMQPVPLLCAVAGAAMLVALDRFAGRPVAGKLAAHGKLLLGIIAGVLVALIAFAVVATQVTGSIQMAAGETLRRGIYPEAGTYKISAEGSGSVSVRIESQNKVDTMMHTSTVLYSGELSEAEFTVPEDSVVVYLNFTAQDDVLLERVTCEGSAAVEVSLGYKLLPGFIANRLQGLFANQNAIQRTVFFEDGMKIFLRHPLFGAGLGGYENAIKSVQTFSYETKYAHNHYIQALADTGLVGLILFVTVIVAAGIAIFLERKKGEMAHPLTPALAAVLVFMAGHAMMEVDFSYYSYIPVAFGAIAVIDYCCGDAFSVRWFGKKTKKRVLLTCGALTMVFTVFLLGNMFAKTLSSAASFDALQRAAQIDVFENNDYMLSYVVSSEQYPEDEAIQQQAEKFAQKLAKEDSNTIPYYLAMFYFDRGMNEQGLDMMEKYVRYVPSDQTAWDKTFEMMYAYSDDSELFKERSREIVAFMEEWNAQNHGAITMSEWGYALILQYE